MRSISMAKIVIGVVIVASLSACATGPKFQEAKNSFNKQKENEGRIFIYRSNNMFGAAIQPAVLINGVEVGSSVPGGFFFVDRQPGTVEVSTSTEVEKKVSFLLEADQTRYVRTSIGLGVFVGRVIPELVDNLEGENEIRNLSYTGKTASR